MMTLAGWLLAFVLALLSVMFIVRSRAGALFHDVPNERSLHETPVPRIGGAGLLLAAALAFIALGDGSLMAPFVIALFLGAIFFLDDARGLPVGVRFLAQGVAGVGALLFVPIQPLIVVPLALLTIMWMSNLFNFMDGSDGLAGGMALFGFGSYALLAATSGSADLALLSAALSGAAAGFLVWNFHRAKIFMGDCGSIPLGLLAAVLGVAGWQQGTWPFWVPPLIFSPFIADASVTLLKRFLRGERLSQAHRTHYYQRYLQMGAGHRRTALAGYALMIGAGASAYFGASLGAFGAIALVAVWIGLYAALMRVVDQRWRVFTAERPQTAA